MRFNFKPKQFVLGMFIALLVVIPTLTATTALAWNTNISASADCENGQAVIHYSFTNNETGEDHHDMKVTVKDEQTGQSQNLGVIQAGSKVDGQFGTNQNSLNGGTVDFFLTWETSNPQLKGQSDTQKASYSGVSCTSTQPTPTASSSATPTSTPSTGGTGGGSSPAGNSSTTNAPVCSDGSTIQLVANPFVVRKGTQATVNFFITQGDRANIYYKVVGKPDWQYSVIGLTPNSDKFVSYTISALDANLGYDFGIQQVQGCGGGQLATAVIVDGPVARTFGFSFWEWSK